MIEIPDACYEERAHNGSRLVCEEGGRRVIFRKSRGNSAQKIRVDGCVLKNRTGCDYLVRDWRGRMHFVELKGGHIQKGLQQIEASIPHFVDRPLKDGSLSREKSIWCFVIGTSSPPNSLPGFQNQKARLAKRWNATVIVKTDQHEHRLA